MAVNNDKVVIPILRLKDLKKLPLRVHRYQGIDFQNYKAGLEELLQTLLPRKEG
ncbi:MAG: hypothetical protein IPK17_17565 [Chloroflexi bacterium]|uniref:hypothetical protein n=1 Tax=Candidatus Flexifilum breve TaxID=3140694 RepID=UPI00313491CB|nr:hypothetical protein [Chloroflexota bacterium]